jgi:lipopolysaccharide biosynthesis glycosyltransferase
VNSQTTIRVFIGSGEASLIECKTAIHSLRKHTTRALDIYVFNGTHNAVRLNDEEPFLAPMSLRIKYRNITEFSLYRFLIPELCDFQGKAIYIDSDTVCLSDIGELFDTPMEGADFLAKHEAYPGEELWGLSVMLIDCGRCRFDLEQTVDEVDAGLYSMSDFSCMSPRFLSQHAYKIGRLDPAWNVFDKWDSHTKLIHYTNLDTQPWKYPNHPYGELWFSYFNEALAAGYVTSQDIDLSMIRAYVRRDLLDGNFKPQASSLVKQLAAPVKRVLKDVASRINIV